MLPLVRYGAVSVIFGEIENPVVRLVVSSGLAATARTKCNTEEPFSFRLIRKRDGQRIDAQQFGEIAQGVVGKIQVLLTLKVIDPIPELYALESKASFELGLGINVFPAAPVLHANAHDLREIWRDARVFLVLAVRLVCGMFVG